MSKQISVVVESCQECPYCRYDSDYGRSYDSGYDCDHPERPGDSSRSSKRIVDDWDVNNSNNPKPAGWPPIPSWCPLSDVPSK